MAHSVNYFEENTVKIGLERSGSGDFKLHTIGTTHSRPATFSKGEMIELKDLSRRLLSIVDAEYDTENDRVWDFLDALPPSELGQILSPQKDGEFNPPGRARKKFS